MGLILVQFGKYTHIGGRNEYEKGVSKGCKEDGITVEEVKREMHLTCYIIIQTIRCNKDISGQSTT